MGRIAALKTVLTLIAWILACGPALASTRVALVIGNARYEQARDLSNPANDAHAVAAVLRQIGFDDVREATDLGADALRRAVLEFGRRASSADVAVVYYAGHGIEVGGRNLLVPVDARLEYEQDAELEALPLDVLLAQVRGARQFRLVILDACRDNPFLARMKTQGQSMRSLTRGLARVEPAGATFVAYAAKEGTTASDGAAGANSPYAAALVRTLPTPGLPLERLFGAVRDEVLRATGNTQEPHLYGSFGREPLYLVPPAPAAAPATGQGAGGAGAATGVDRETVFWQSIQASTRADEFEAYLRLFPEGLYVPLARARLAALRAPPQVAVVTPPPPPAPARTAVQQIVGIYPEPSAAFRDWRADGAPCPECPEMVIVPPGSFLMGSPANERERDEDEGPQRRISIARAFAVGKFEVTRGQWAAFARASGRGVEPGCSAWNARAQRFEPDRQLGWQAPGFEQGDDHPVVCVSWDDAKAYVAWLAQITGKSYRLLSEAEWEYAARAGAGAARWWGADAARACEHANVADRTAKRRNAALNAHDCDDGQAHTAPVGSYLANRFGLHDTLGNVAERLEDCWNPNHANAPVDGGARLQGQCQSRVVRGGSWLYDPQSVRSAARNRGTTTQRSADTGFRVARGL
jgi:formylglycine-generating enzyme required for sulfatase activity